MLSMGLNVLSMNARMFTSVGEKQGAATSLDGGGDGKADLMRGLSSRSSCGGACDSSSIQSAARCPKAGHSTLSKGGFISASTTR